MEAVREYFCEYNVFSDAASHYPAVRRFWVLGLVACGRIQFDPITDDGGSIVDDGPIGGDDTIVAGDADLATSCVQPATTCAFNGPGTCSCWGTPIVSSATVTESGGQLRIAPAANTLGATGACQRMNVPLTDVGIFAEVSQIVSTSQGVTELDVAGTSETFSIQVTGTTLLWGDGTDGGNATYNAVAMRWWRIRPLATGTTFERSADGNTWTPLGTVPQLPPSGSYTVRISGTTALGVAAPGAAIFEGINVCPP